jgi:hypothetical protein
MKNYNIFRLDIWLFLVTSIRPGIRQLKSGIRPESGYQKRIRRDIRCIPILVSILGMHRISGQPDIRPDNPAFFDFRYPAGYQIVLPDIRPDIR